MDVPTFAELPKIPNGPRGCAWGVWNTVHEALTGKTGEKDGLGTLNHLTAAVVAAAGKEIQTGERATLNWPLDAYEHVGFNRKKLDMKMLDGQVTSGGRFIANDDEIAFNTQISSQWDGLCHFAHQKSALYYNGVTHEEMQSSRRCRPGSVHVWSKHGGICGRGVLLDYAAYAAAHGIRYSPGESHAITAAVLDKVAAWEAVDLRAGDVLLVRTGWTAWHDALDEAGLAALTRDRQNHAGLATGEAGETTAAWIWDHRFAAVAADNPTLEMWPPAGKTQMLHEYLLAMLGCPIGELWDLEALARLCAKNKRYSFFLASVPLNVQGAIATPANAVAIL